MSGARKKNVTCSTFCYHRHIYRITESTKDLAISYWLLSTKNQHDHPRCI